MSSFRGILIGLLSIILVTNSSVRCSEFNHPCQTDEECFDIYTHSYKCIENHCMRRYFNYSLRELLGGLVVIFVASVANAGGLGAGAVIIPIYMFFYDFSATDAIPLSKITIFAGAVVTFIFNCTDRHHKNKNKFVIDYPMASILIPLLLAGTTSGIMMSRFLPGLIITFCLISYLVLSTYKLYQRGMQLHKQESKAKLESSKILIT